MSQQRQVPCRPHRDAAILEAAEKHIDARAFRRRRETQAVQLFGKGQTTGQIAVARQVGEVPLRATGRQIGDVTGRFRRGEMIDGLIVLLVRSNVGQASSEDDNGIRCTNPVIFLLPVGVPQR